MHANDCPSMTLAPAALIAVDLSLPIIPEFDDYSFPPIAVCMSEVIWRFLAQRWVARFCKLSNKIGH
jgi:hypothetical protein